MLDCSDEFPVDVRGSIDNCDNAEVKDDKLDLWDAKIENLFNQIKRDYDSGDLLGKKDYLQK